MNSGDYEQDWQLVDRLEQIDQHLWRLQAMILKLEERVDTLEVKAVENGWIYK